MWRLFTFLLLYVIWYVAAVHGFGWRVAALPFVVVHIVLCLLFFQATSKGKPVSWWQILLDSECWTMVAVFALLGFVPLVNAVLCALLVMPESRNLRPQPSPPADSV